MIFFLDIYNKNETLTTKTIHTGHTIYTLNKMLGSTCSECDVSIDKHFLDILFLNNQNGYITINIITFCIYCPSCRPQKSFVI